MKCSASEPAEPELTVWLRAEPDLPGLLCGVTEVHDFRRLVQLNCDIHIASFRARDLRAVEASHLYN